MKVITKITNILDVFHLSRLRNNLKISWREKIRNDEVVSRAESRNLSDMVAKRRIQLTGHILRLPEVRFHMVERDKEVDQTRLVEQQ